MRIFIQLLFIIAVAASLTHQHENETIDISFSEVKTVPINQCIFDKTEPINLRFTDHSITDYQILKDRNGRQYTQFKCSGNHDASVKWWIRRHQLFYNTTSYSDVINTYDRDYSINEWRNNGFLPHITRINSHTIHVNDDDDVIVFCSITSQGQTLMSEQVRTHLKRKKGPTIMQHPAPVLDAPQSGCWFRCLLDIQDNVIPHKWSWYKRINNTTSLVTSDKRYLGTSTNFLQILNLISSSDEGAEYACEVNNTFGHQRSSFAQLHHISQDYFFASPWWSLYPPKLIFRREVDDVTINLFAYYGENHPTIYGLIRLNNGFTAEVICWSGVEPSDDCIVEGGQFFISHKSHIFKNNRYFTEKFAILVAYKGDRKYKKLKSKLRSDFIMNWQQEMKKFVSLDQFHQFEIITTDEKTELSIKCEENCNYVEDDVIEYAQKNEIRLRCKSDQDPRSSGQVYWYHNMKRVDVVPNNGDRNLTGSYQRYMTSQESELVIYKIDEKTQGYWTCRQQRFTEDVHRTIQLIMKQKLEIPPVVTSVTATLRNGNNIVVEWKVDDHICADYFRYVAIVRSFDPSGDQEVFTYTANGNCSEGSCSAFIADVQSYTPHYVTIRGEMVTSPIAYYSVESPPIVIETTGCAPPEAVLNDDFLGTDSWMITRHRISPTTYFVAWILQPGHKQCGDITKYHIITGHGYEMEEKHIEVSPSVYELPMNITIPLNSTTNTHRITNNENRFFYTLFENVREGEQFWWTIKPETKFGFRPFHPAYPPSSILYHQYKPDKQYRYDVTPFIGTEKCPEKDGNVASRRVKCRFGNYEPTSKFVDKYFQMNCTWRNDLIRNESLFDFRLTNLFDNFSLHRTCNKDDENITLPINDIFGAYQVTVQATYASNPLQSCFVLSDVIYLGRYLESSGDEVIWKDAFVSTVTANITWAYVPREEDAMRKLEHFEIRYFPVYLHHDERDDFVVVQRRENWLLVDNLDTGIDYKFQLRPVFDDFLPTKDFIIPPHSIFTHCSNNNTDGIPQVNADVTATFVKEVAYEFEWSEIDEVYPNLITRDYTFIFKYLGNDDRNNNKSLNISVGEEQVFTADGKRKRAFLACMKEGDYSLEMKILFAHCQLFQFTSQKYFFHFQSDDDIECEEDIPAFLFKHPETTTKHETTTVALQTTTTTTAIIVATTAPTTTTTVISSYEVVEERTVKTTTITTILSTVIPLVVIIIFILIIWKFGVGQTRSRNLIHKSIFCFDCRKSSAENRNPPNPTPTSDFISTKDKSIIDGYIRPQDAMNYDEIVRPPTEEPLLSQITTHVQIKNEKIRNHQREEEENQKVTSSSPRGFVAKLRRCFGGNGDDQDYDDVTSSHKMKVDDVDCVEAAPNELPYHQDHRSLETTCHVPVHFSHPIPRHSFRYDVTNLDNTTTTLYHPNKRKISASVEEENDGEDDDEGEEYEGEELEVNVDVKENEEDEGEEEEEDKENLKDNDVKEGVEEDVEEEEEEEAEEEEVESSKENEEETLEEEEDEGRNEIDKLL